MIARHGAVPITESALRARIRNRRVGALKSGGRIYTNPLNLVAAGLLPVDALSGSGGPSAEIDDAELHAWLNPDEARTEPNEESDGNRSRDETGGGGHRNEAEPSGDAGPVERALARGARPAERSARAARATERPIDRGPRRPWRSLSGKAVWRSSLVLVGSVIAAGAVVVAMVASAQSESGNAGVAPLDPVALAGPDFRPPAKLIDRAITRRDYDTALDLAALSGDAVLLVQTQRQAADALLARAERSRKRGALSGARRDVRTVRARFGDPRPSATQAVSARIARDERQARLERQRAKETALARSADATATQAPAATATRTTPQDSNSAAVQSATQTSSPQAGSGSRESPKSTRQRDADRPVDPGLF